MKAYKLIEHTADVGIRVGGKDLKELFKNAAAAMFDIIAEPRAKSEGRRAKKITVRQDAETKDELFINWLNELLSLSATKEIIFSDFTIKKLTEKSIEAVASGSDAADYQMNVEIKAATYHELKIEKSGSLWRAEVIFDV